MASTCAGADRCLSKSWFNSEDVHAGRVLPERAQLQLHLMRQSSKFGEPLPIAATQLRQSSGFELPAKLPTARELASASGKTACMQGGMR